MSVVSLSLTILGSPAARAEAEPAPPWPVTLRTQLVRLNETAYRINKTAASECPRIVSGTGISFDYLGAYEADDRPAIAVLLNMNETPQVAAIASDSPAARSGLKVGDNVLAINGTTTEQMLEESNSPAFFADELNGFIASLPIDSPIKLSVERDGSRLQITVAPEPACSARPVLKTGEGISAYTDGEDVGVSAKLIGYTKNDDELAIIVAHEIGHVINRDGKPAGLFEQRRMEDAADLVGARLMQCAGYDLESGLHYFLRREDHDLLRWFRSPSHRGRKGRVKRMRAQGEPTTCPEVSSLDAK
ncbi:M48 family metallopeptidase [Novosphingobium sp. BW1]|uniref:M48 family metallopeptidase n=1 Tax=Novosphingobium sp. BW1 TaxID=2592621 RepID=UPI0013969033|nr:M48 family metallopeptidase [Novosphingobium sp. BW1]